MKSILNIVAILLAFCPKLFAQSAPEATAGHADLRYTFRYSQSAEFGGGLGDWQTANLSAELNYSNGKSRLPFSMDYTGGYVSTIEGPSYGTGMFQRLLLSQGLVWPKWNLQISDNVSYLPEAPITGFAGIPGIGEPIGVPNPAPPSSQSILTLNTHAVENTALGQLSHILNYATSLSLGGSSDLLRFPDDNGIDTDSQMANAGLTYRINALNSLSAQYIFSQFSYPDYNYTFMTNSALFGLRRTWNRRLSSSVSAGPEWTGDPDSKVVPSSLGVSAQGSVAYQIRSLSAGLGYTRNVTGGSGYMLGAETDSVTATLSRVFDQKLTLGLTGGYTRNTELGTPNVVFGSNGTFESELGGVEVSRQLGRFLSFFANYTVTTQSTAGSVPSNVLNELWQSASIGLTYTRETNPNH